MRAGNKRIETITRGQKFQVRLKSVCHQGVHHESTVQSWLEKIPLLPGFIPFVEESKLPSGTQLSTVKIQWWSVIGLDHITWKPFQVSWA
jgi:hypothetical protein